MWNLILRGRLSIRNLVSLNNQKTIMIYSPDITFKLLISTHVKIAIIIHITNLNISKTIRFRTFAFVTST